MNHHGWNCSACTYRHNAPGLRCVMCNELRVNKTHMRDFIMGKPIPSTVLGGPNRQPPDASTATTILAAGQPQSSTAARPRKPATKQMTINPYAKGLLSKTTKATATTTISTTRMPPQRRLPPAVRPPTRWLPMAEPSNTLSHPTWTTKPVGLAWPGTTSSTNAAALRKGSPAAARRRTQNNSNTNHNNNHAAAARHHSTFTPAMDTVAPGTRPQPQQQQQQQQHAQQPSRTPVATKQTALAWPSSTTTVAARSDPPVASVPLSASNNHDNYNHARHAAVMAPRPQQPLEATAGPRNPSHAMVAGSVAGSSNTVRNVHSTSNNITASRKRARRDPIASHHPNKRKLPYQPGPVPLDPTTADTWIYPSAEKYPKRQYQFEITESAIFQNTLVSLPTGLGKTLIAAVVLYNYYRWFPTGKVVFLAPTLPLVDQQVQACHAIAGLPAKDTALLTGKVPAAQRAAIWQAKRVFFATPQTMQRDLEDDVATTGQGLPHDGDDSDNHDETTARTTTRCPAQRIVCVVFDEAHKATGDYAYTKVVARLHQLGAKVRLVGLSATPGSSLAAIQSVVDVLRSHVICARTDADPDVAPYVHHRVYKTIVVQPSAAANRLEKRLTAVLAPVVEQIRARQGLKNRPPGATLMPYCILQAREMYFKSREQQQHHQQPRDDALLGYYAAALALLSIRVELHARGMGCARSKMATIMRQRQRGHMATIVKSEPFQTLWKECQEASCDPAASNNSIDDKTKNNPKLSCLVAELEEHFKSARKNGASSRAIVFSQFRDSVAEIVDVVNAQCQPMIRARYFVGQSKGSASANTGEQGGRVMGMKQQEQKAVIAEFRNNVHNCLVCTCIGEEGLDIGEVDLIVNFDCLSSPIRMIQRVGRTGRKRQGRVVTLVSAGAEQRTLEKSKQNERTLLHALRRPETFTVLPDKPMFPGDPVVVEQNMTIARGFRMSQVRGAAKTKRRRLSSSERRRKMLGTGSWRLTELEERQRVRALGTLSDLRLEDCTNDNKISMPVVLQRRLLTARAVSLSQSNSKMQRRIQLGRTSLLLRRIESVHSNAHNTSTPKWARRIKSNETVLDKLFPLVNCKAHVESFIDWTALDSTQLTMPLASVSNIPLSSEPQLPREASKSARALFAESCKRQTENKKNTNTTETALQQSKQKQPHEIVGTNPSERVRNLGIESKRAPVVNPYASRATGNTDHSSALLECTIKAPDSSSMMMPPEHETADVVERHTTVATAKINSFAMPPPEHTTRATSNQSSESGVEPDSNGVLNEFCLPSQSDSSDSSGDDEESTSNAEKEAVGEEAFRLPTQSSDDDDSVGSEHAPPAVEGDQFNRPKEAEFRLPTPESSSSENESEREEAIEKGHTEVDEALSKVGLDSFTPEHRTSSVKVHFSGQSLVNATKYLSCSSIENIRTRNKRMIAIQDTQDTPQPKANGVVKTNQSHDLDDTQEDSSDDVDRIVCAICSENHVTDTNPIIFCDGRRGGGCDLAVHCLCYSATVNLKDVGEWRCDSCKLDHDSDHTIDSFPQCSQCHKTSSQGPMKLCAEGQWRHVHCMQPTKPRFKRLRRKKRQPLVDLARNGDKPKSPDSQEEADLRLMRRRQCLERFIDNEASAESGDDMGGDSEEDEDAFAIEEEEQAFARDFINDSSQLGYLEDELDAADPQTTNISHRTLDNEQARKREFATPNLNRRIHHRAAGSSQWSGTSSASKSLRGLGSMHFIRSVLEHQRQGGNVDDIEKLYNELEHESDEQDETEWE